MSDSSRRVVPPGDAGDIGAGLLALRHKVSRSRQTCPAPSLDQQAGPTRLNGWGQSAR